MRGGKGPAVSASGGARGAGGFERARAALPTGRPATGLPDRASSWSAKRRLLRWRCQASLPLPASAGGEVLAARSEAIVRDPPTCSTAAPTWRRCGTDARNQELARHLGSGADHKAQGRDSSSFDYCRREPRHERGQPARPCPSASELKVEYCSATVSSSVPKGLFL